MNTGHVCSEGAETKWLLNLFLEQQSFFKKTSDSYSLRHSTKKTAMKQRPQSPDTVFVGTFSAVGMLAANCPSYKSVWSYVCLTASVSKRGL